MATPSVPEVSAKVGRELYHNKIGYKVTDLSNWMEYGQFFQIRPFSRTKQTKPCGLGLMSAYRAHMLELLESELLLKSGGKEEAG